MMKSAFVADDNKSPELSPVPLFENIIDLEESDLFEQNAFGEAKPGASFEIGGELFFQGEGAHLGA
jgi:hypothetical protein